MKKKLIVGDVIHVGNPLLSDDYSYYRVNEIDGNRAKTNFRVFNTKVYFKDTVFEYGKQRNSLYDNNYTVVKPDANRKIL